MRIAAQPGAVHHRLELVPQQRNFPRPARVGTGREQSDETPFRHRHAIGIEFEHADVIHVSGTMHAGAGIGLGQDDCIDCAGLRQVARGQRLERARRHRAIAAVQDAKARAIHGLQHFLAAGFGDAIFPIAKKREMIGRRPAQEFLRLGNAGRIHGQLLLAQVLGDRQHLVAHRRPVAIAHGNVVQRRTQDLFKARAFGRIGNAVDLEMHQRFGLALAGIRSERKHVAAGIALDAVHRMRDQMHVQAGLPDRDADRIDQERHVVGDDVDDRMRGIVTVGVLRRVRYTQIRRAGFAHARELQQPAHHPRPAGNVMCTHVFGIDAAEEVFNERPRQWRRRGAKRRQDRMRKGVVCALDGAGIGVHGNPSGTGNTGCKGYPFAPSIRQPRTARRRPGNALRQTWFSAARSRCAQSPCAGFPTCLRRFR